MKFNMDKLSLKSFDVIYLLNLPSAIQQEAEVIFINVYCFH